jgi:hypothetical protein
MWFRRQQTRQMRMGIADECDAFLRGEYVEYASAMGWNVPVWAWINAVAHADQDRLVRLALVGYRHDIALSGRREWSRAVSCIASAVVEETSRTGRELAELQASLFVPLEMVLIDDETTWDLSANQLMAVAVAVLRRHPSSRY